MDLHFPKGFLFGAATSAHQVEGGCTNNQWWEWEQTPGNVHDGSTSELACDHYRRYGEDFALARDLGMNAQRISVEWSRIEPEEGRFDEAELDHYRDACDTIRDLGMEPAVTLHHFTNPIWAQRQGGWENAKMMDWLARYSERTAEALGDRVRFWFTINEPMVAPALSYVMGIHPPCVRDLSRALPVAKHVLLAHAAMYNAIKNAVAHVTEVGPVLQMPYIEALDPDDPADRDAAAQQDQLFNQYYLDGLLKGVVAPPVGDGAEVPGLARSYDVVGLNYYARMLVRGGDLDDAQHPAGGAHEARDRELPLLGARRPSEPSPFEDQMGWEVYPKGLYTQLMRLDPLGCPVYVTESGMATRDEEARSRHLLAHLAEVHRAIRDGLDLRGFFYWTLMDNFEWAEGYTKTFGLIEIDRADDLARRPRQAALLYRDIARSRAISEEMLSRHAVA
jgi:beta-glucosidase